MTSRRMAHELDLVATKRFAGSEIECQEPFNPLIEWGSIFSQIFAVVDGY